MTCRVNQRRRPNPTVAPCDLKLRFWFFAAMSRFFCKLVWYGMNRVNVFAIHRCINEGYGLLRIFTEKIRISPTKLWRVCMRFVFTCKCNACATHAPPLALRPAALRQLWCTFDSGRKLLRTLLFIRRVQHALTLLHALRPSSDLDIRQIRCAFNVIHIVTWLFAKWSGMLLYCKT